MTADTDLVKTAENEAEEAENNQKKVSLRYFIPKIS